MPLLLLVLCVAVLGAIGFLRAWRSRRRLEFRARLLEVLAVACRHARPLPPLLVEAGWEHTRREQHAVLALHTALHAGAPLAEALERAGPRFFGPEVVGAVRAAEGTAALAPTLAALAEDDGRTLHLRHRLYLVALYPAVLVLLAVGLHAGITQWAFVLDGMRSRALGEAALYPVLWLVLGSAAVWFVGDWLHRRGRLPGSGLLASARVLRTAGLLTDAGLPLPAALRQAAPATRNRPLARRAASVARHLEAGGDPHGAWAGLRLPRAWLARLRVAPATGVGDLLRGLADRCLLRHRRRGERLARWVLPVVLLAVGAVVLANYERVFETIIATHQELERGLRLW